MAVYLVATLFMDDTAWLKDYGLPTEALIEKHGGHYVVKSLGDDAVMYEGEVPVFTAVIYFPSREHAQAWYHDPEWVCCINPIYALCWALVLGWRQTCVAQGSTGAGE